jgi:hypothetical protein
MGPARRTRDHHHLIESIGQISAGQHTSPTQGVGSMRRADVIAAASA